MRQLKITPQQADAAYSVLVQHAGANDVQHERHAFVRYVTSDAACAEYRFRGTLGSGGKFRNNGNRDAPYVDCYREHETPERLETIRVVNSLLAELFAAAIDLPGSAG